MQGSFRGSTRRRPFTLVASDRGDALELRRPPDSHRGIVGHDRLNLPRRRLKREERHQG
jgi:hypothetical protein